MVCISSDNVIQRQMKPFYVFQQDSVFRSSSWIIVMDIDDGCRNVMNLSLCLKIPLRLYDKIGCTRDMEESIAKRRVTEKRLVQTSNAELHRDQWSSAHPLLRVLV